MSNEIQKISSVKQFMALPSTQKRVTELLGDRTSQFMTSVSSMVGADDKLAKCEPVSLFMACLTAAALDLPINKNLGFAHIVPYENRKAGVTEAQFQIGWKGFVQLAQRTGQYKTINAIPVYTGQLVHQDPLNGNQYDWDAQVNDDVIGYVGVMKLVTGFEKEIYMSVEQMEKHATKYSQSYKSTNKWVKENSPWSTNFDAMALKTIIKQLISKWGPMSVDIQQAVASDQAVIKEDGSNNYIDGDVLEDEKATSDEKNAILAANAEEVDPEDMSDEDLAAAMDNQKPKKK